MVSEMMIDISATMCIISIEPPDNGAPEREEPFIWVVSFLLLGSVMVENKRESAGRINGLERVRGLRSANGFSNTGIAWQTINAAVVTPKGGNNSSVSLYPNQNHLSR